MEDLDIETTYEPLLAEYPGDQKRTPNLCARTQVAFVYGADLWVADLNGQNVLRLTSTPAVETDPHFSPDGKWIVFTAYFDHYGDDHGCEIYIIRIDGTDLRRLTDNNYCDYQPRWGP